MTKSQECIEHFLFSLPVKSSNVKGFQILLKNFAIHQSELINLINRLGFFCQSLKLGQTHAILLCSLLVADKFFGSLLGFLNIFSCVSHGHFSFLPRTGIVRYWSCYFGLLVSMQQCKGQQQRVLLHSCLGSCL